MGTISIINPSSTCIWIASQLREQIIIIKSIAYTNIQCTIDSCIWLCLLGYGYNTFIIGCTWSCRCYGIRMSTIAIVDPCSARIRGTGQLREQIRIRECCAFTNIQCSITSCIWLCLLYNGYDTFIIYCTWSSRCYCIRVSSVAIVRPCSAGIG